MSAPAFTPEMDERIGALLAEWKLPAVSPRGRTARPRWRGRDGAAIEPADDCMTLVPQAPSFRTSEAENLLEGTFQMPDDLARKLAGVPATPLERVDRGMTVPIEAPWVEAVEASEDWVSEDLSEDVLTPIAAVKVAPPVEVARPALLVAPKEEASEQPEGLGAEFLAAMAAEGETA